jgi:DNA-binding transcriptional LysR family regulator
MHLTAAGCGIGILPSCFAQALYPTQLECIPNAPACCDEIYLVYRKENRDVKAVSTVINTIKKFFEEARRLR